MAPSEAISERAQSGFAKSAAYDQHRPAYTSTVVEVLLKNLGVSGKNGAVIVDLAAGTGKFTGALAARVKNLRSLRWSLMATCDVCWTIRSCLTSR